MRKIDLIWIAVMLLVLGGLYCFFQFAPVADDELAYHPVDVGGGSITIVDQNQTDLVTFSTTLVAPGFVTIHETMSDAPAAVIGTSGYLETGEHQNVIISLDTPMSSGYKYVALLHADNGDQQFVMEEDLPVMVNGEVIRPSFVAIPEAVE
ncbi:MAG: hypothetical protein WCT24_02710 [Patescibacteria group bacterium]|jgi:hypothetical protein